MNFDRLAFFERQVSRPFQPSMRFAVSEAVERYEGLANGTIPTGLKTGFNYLDNATGGLKPGNYIAIGAPSGVGKTTFALNIANHVAVEQRLPVALFSLEMSKGEIIDFLFALNSRIDRNHFNSGKFTPEELDRIAAGQSKLKGAAFVIFDDGNIGISELRADCEIMAQDSSIGLIVVDYVQLMSDGGRGDFNREQEVAKISRGLKSLARDHNCPVIVLSQLNEQGKVRESRSIFNDANIVLILSETPSGDMNVEITKGRNVPRGHFDLGFEAVNCRLSNP
jgi:replicative DNA helicase